MQTTKATTHPATILTTLAIRSARAAWEGGGSLERTSRPVSERYCPLESDYEAAGVGAADRGEFARQFEHEARSITE